MALCLVLVAMTVAAWYVSHRRGGALRIALGPPREVGQLLVSVPAGWAVRVYPTDHLVDMTDPVRWRGGGGGAGEGDEDERPPLPRRRLLLTQTLQRTAGRADPLQFLAAKFAVVGSPDEPFPFLGQPGVLVEVSRDEDGGADAGLYACTVLPDGLTVVIRFHGPAAFGPSGREVLRQFADGIARKGQRKVI